ncbi:2-amino-4-hydroxy-6-hydroxymethyldihydropteridine diphosphokinase [Actinokineospora xionganensis]|uniref:2-amino-4-hydroxy-6-hydroxymethyldihydropteridine diphosphokinase n=1 Tax=Actinokineospora xionganensis TaxID=2684470 RepID=A0ABR7L2X3_9PSEU|nr:2-amino-4-hydroxy-6-hydroxymethyldihydropteridine diphosphokinase [Actinokineospora xionganensis]MBC6447047.1 2-amino-4-hydroxy-6-hydroxymethyldihydropteridine diphosphokinase [Actinokineospora xionganensis]
MTRAVLSIGSNLGDRAANLRIAVDGLADVLIAVSPVYETAAWGVTDQPDFLNAVLIVEDDATDEWGWLRRAQELENRAGRVRTLRWGPRTLDVDVVTVDGVRGEHPDLLLPHPGTHERATVLIPWLDIEPDAEVPGRGSARDLLATLDTGGVRRRDDLDLGVAR